MNDGGTALELAANKKWSWKCEKCLRPNSGERRKCHWPTCGWCPRCGKQCRVNCGKSWCKGWCKHCNRCTECRGKRSAEDALNRLRKSIQERTCGKCALHGGERTCPKTAADRCGGGKGVIGCKLKSEHSWIMHKAVSSQVRRDLMKIHGENIIFLLKERDDSRASSG